MIREIWYECTRFFLRTMLSFFYKKVDIKGLDTLPKKTPVIFAPNHQNAFMDALMVVTFCYHKIWFLTRADIFKKKVAIFLLNSLRLTPVYRQRDGLDALEKNKDVFHKCYLNFNKGESILVFPEGNHKARRQLRPVSKGTTRIAFGYEEDMGFDKELAIVPVGLTYSEPTRYYGSAKVVHGKPIYLQDYMAEYKEKPQVAMRKLTAKIKEELEANMLNIPEDNYEVIDFLLRLDDKIFNLHSVQELQSISEKMNDKLNENPEKAEELKSKIDGMPMLKKNKPSIIQLILSFLFIPFYLLSFIAVPHYLIVKNILKKMNDVAFKSSMKVGLSMYLGVPYFLFLMVLAGIFVPGLYLKVGAIVFVFFSFFVFLYYTNLWMKLKNWKFFNVRKELLSARTELVS
jgi:1-acyl-sn-glycerol-3-phosphate acyltransferase